MLAPHFSVDNLTFLSLFKVYACGLIFWEIMTWGVYGYPFQSMIHCLFIVESSSHVITTDLAEHALYLAVKDHDIRPPISKLTALYPRNLLVLVMEMWETDPSLVWK